MNYYERHLGDYAKNCGHLTLLEHGVYVRLLDVYYTREEPIPDNGAARLIGARTEPETQALQVVLQEFFKLRNGHWHQERADEEIESYAEGEPEREVKKANEDNRLKRHRAERAALFKVITDAGQHAPWNIGITELRKLAEGVSGGAIETPPATRPATATATPATATHSPDTIPQTPLPIEKEKGRAPTPVAARAPDPHPPPEPNGHPPTPAGLACRAMRQAGLQAVNPGDPRLIALLEQGVTAEELTGVTAEAVAKAKGFAWVLTVVQARRAEAAAIELAPAPAADPMAWAATRDGVINRGCALGIGPWDQVKGTTGHGPTWPQYRKRVLDAHEQQGAIA